MHIDRKMMLKKMYVVDLYKIDVDEVEEERKSVIDCKNTQRLMLM